MMAYTSFLNFLSWK